MQQILGSKDWIGKTTLEILPNEAGRRYSEEDKKLKEIGYTISEGNVKHLNGDVREYETQKFTINRLGKEPILGGISIDITVRKNAEKAMLQAKENLEKEVDQRTSELLIAKELAEKNEAKFKLLFNSGNDPMFVRQLDSNNKFSNLIYVNDIATEKYGYSKDEFFKMMPSDLVDPITFHNHDLRGLKDLIENRKVTFESVHLTKNGEKINVELSGRFFELEGENVVLYIIRDITDRKKSEKAAIESQRLIAIGEMASSIAHDFNNSLQAMRGNIDVLKTVKTIPSSANEYLEIVDGIISDVAIRVKSLQRFGDTKQIVNEYKPAHLNKTIQEVILQLRPMWKDKLEKEGFKIDIQEEYDENLLILCNEGELKTVFYNIIKNSIESMGFGGTIKIETSKNDNMATVTIQDTGDGMDEETKLKIFQPFYTTKGFEVGRGLGMSGVFSIVKGHNGNIHVKQSELGKGTTIELSFPIDHTNEIKGTKKDIDSTIKNPEKLTILVVEDIASIRDSFAKMISLLGHNCDKAESGMAALAFLENKSYDIVFTDLGMSEMSGWQLADIIKEKFEGKISVVVVSGWDVSEDETQKHGVSFAINKPFTIAEIKNVISKIATK
jgi:PAS domain S-box-containing protein